MQFKVQVLHEEATFKVVTHMVAPQENVTNVVVKVILLGWWHRTTRTISDKVEEIAHQLVVIQVVGIKAEAHEVVKAAM